MAAQASPALGAAGPESPDCAVQRCLSPGNHAFPAWGVTVMPPICHACGAGYPSSGRSGTACPSLPAVTDIREEATPHEGNHRERRSPRGGRRGDAARPGKAGATRPAAAGGPALRGQAGHGPGPHQEAGPRLGSSARPVASGWRTGRQLAWCVREDRDPLRVASSTIASNSAGERVRSSRAAGGKTTSRQVPQHAQFGVLRRVMWVRSSPSPFLLRRL
jgi:hypothetical protein